MQASVQVSTRNCYTHHWDVFENFRKSLWETPCFPATSDEVCLFVAHLYNTGYQPSTIRNYLSAISFRHKIPDSLDPTVGFKVTKVLQGALSLSKKTGKPVLKPITKSILHALIGATKYCILDNYQCLMYKALFLISFYACLRAGEVVHTNKTSHTLLLNQVRLHDTQCGKGYEIFFNSYKHSGLAQPKVIIEPLHSKYCPVGALRKYITARGNQPGPLFMTQEGRALNRQEFSTALKECLEFKRYPSELFNTHSFRIGRATELASQNVPENIIKSTGRWKSSAYLKYIRPSHFTLPH